MRIALHVRLASAAIALVVAASDTPAEPTSRLTTRPTMGSTTRPAASTRPAYFSTIHDDDPAPPPALCETYARFVRAARSGASIDAFLLPGLERDIELEPRAERERGGLNVPFLRSDFSPDVRGAMHGPAGTWWLRTETSEINFIQTRTDGWKIYRHLDHPRE